MSLYKLKNISTSPITDIDFNGNTVVFDPGVLVDVIDGPYGIQARDLSGIDNGPMFNNVCMKIRGGNFVLNDGDRDLTKDEALYLLKYRAAPKSRVVADFSDEKTGVSFESFNWADQSSWPSPTDSFWVIAPQPGKVLHLTGSKTMFDTNMVLRHAVTFQVWVTGVPVPVFEDQYNSMYDFLMGAREPYMTPRIGDPTPEGKGAVDLLHIPYKYVEPFTLKSSLGMELRIGIVNDQPLDQGKWLQIRMEAVEETET